ncbi:MAG: tRNA threonylcarbamoyladenosine dehydratase [Christensenellales bacterium]|jgi:tRNA A37 threonylcarbamoyladenosine dehydratase
MSDRFNRLIKVIGESGLSALTRSKVIVFGIGGVGSFAVEAFARAGVGRIDLVDSDTVDITNINRQLIALNSTLGKAKTDVMKERILEINPSAYVKTYQIFYGEDTENLIDLSVYDYVVDAIDSVKSKLLLISNAKKCGAPIISSMGFGNKLNPSMIKAADIKDTSVDPLARIIRSGVKKLNIDSLKVVYSQEKPEPVKGAPGSVSFVPSVAGLMIAGEVIKALINSK